MNGEDEDDVFGSSQFVESDNLNNFNSSQDNEADEQMFADVFACLDALNQPPSHSVHFHGSLTRCQINWGWE